MSNITLIIDGNAIADGGTIEPGERRVQIGLVGSRVGWARIYPQGNRQHPLYSNAASQVTVTFPEGIYTVEANSPSGGPFVVPQQMTLRVSSPKPPAPPPVGGDIITIDDLAKARIESGKKYKLAAKEHRIDAAIRLPSGVMIDATDARIVLTATGWTSAWLCHEVQDVTIIGGSYRLTGDAIVAYVNGCNRIRIRDINIEPDSGGGVTVRGSYGVALYNVSASAIRHYVVFAEHHTNGKGERIDNRDLSLIRVYLSRGSTRESGIRIHATHNLLIDECTINALSFNKQTALRLHDGSYHSVANCTFGGGIGFGPLSEGDGGREWGICDWIDRNGRWINNRTPKPSNVDDAATAARRSAALALRLDGVRFEKCNVAGAFTLNAGVSNLSFDTVTVSDAGIQWVDSVFRKVVSRYPEEDEWTLPGDTLRPAPSGTIRAMKVEGLKFNPPSGFKIVQ